MEMVSSHIVLIGLRLDRSALKKSFKDQFIATKIDRPLAEFIADCKKAKEQIATKS
jgi:hypothetical protein